MSLPQRTRVIVLLVYVSVLVVVNLIAFNSLIPLDIWFWSGVFALALSELIAQPFFTSPRDVISNTVAVLATVLPIITSDSISISNELKISWVVFAVITLIILLSAAFAMVMGKHENARYRNFSAIFTRTTSMVGSPRFLFSIVFLLALWTFNYTSNQLLILMTTWAVIIIARPIENALRLFDRVKSIWIKEPAQKQIGIVHSRRQPNRITIRNTSSGQATIGTNILVHLDNDHCQIGLITDNYLLADEFLSSGLLFANPVRKESLKHHYEWGSQGTVLVCKEDDLPDTVNDLKIYKDKDYLLGLVIEGSDVNLLRIELIREDCALEEGQLVRTEIGGKDVLYQIINGITRSEILEQRNQHGYVEIHARKLGIWNGSTFDQVSWVPQMQSPVFRTETTSKEFCKDYIGYVPNTDYGISVNCNELVTHNTAILGVLGVGKTSLALELIIRMISDGIKVWVIDITGQYEEQLKEYVSFNKQKQADKFIDKVISGYAEKADDNQGTGGNHPKFRKAVISHSREFLEDPDWKLRIFNPSNYNVTEQTRGAYKGEAAFASVTAVQVTRIVTESLLANLQHEITDQAKLCLVLEEAHSLVPEWNSITHDGDRNATNATAKAVLQGRKYGFGCLLVTQRTANVTKSILNQCNTIFGLRVFDATGMGFMSNYVGTDYSNLLATLPNRHSVAFGKGIYAQSPLIIRLNERNDFLENYPMPDISPDDDIEDYDDDEFVPPGDVDDIPF